MMKIHIYMSYMNSELYLENIRNGRWVMFCEMVIKGGCFVEILKDYLHLLVICPCPSRTLRTSVHNILIAIQIADWQLLISVTVLAVAIYEWKCQNSAADLFFPELTCTHKITWLTPLSDNSLVKRRNELHDLILYIISIHFVLLCHFTLL